MQGLPIPLVNAIAPINRDARGLDEARIILEVDAYLKTQPEQFRAYGLAYRHWLTSRERDAVKFPALMEHGLTMDERVTASDIAAKIRDICGH